jgi:hypothetical protein
MVVIPYNTIYNRPIGFLSYYMDGGSKRLKNKDKTFYNVGVNVKAFFKFVYTGIRCNRAFNPELTSLFFSHALVAFPKNMSRYKKQKTLDHRGYRGISPVYSLNRHAIHVLCAL